MATNSPWVWKIGSAWISTSSAVKRQRRYERPRVRGEVLVRQHRALGAAGRARGVEDRGEIVGAARHVVERRRRRGGRASVSDPVAVDAERFDRRRRLAAPALDAPRAWPDRRRPARGSASPRKYSSSASV